MDGGVQYANAVAMGLSVRPTISYFRGAPSVRSPFVSNGGTLQMMDDAQLAKFYPIEESFPAASSVPAITEAYWFRGSRARASAVAFADQGLAENPRMNGMSVAFEQEGITFFERSTGAGGFADDLISQNIRDVYNDSRIVCNPADFHLKCGEPRAMTLAENAGMRPRGGVSAAAWTGGTRHGTLRPACTSCGPALRHFGVEDAVVVSPFAESLYTAESSIVVAQGQNLFHTVHPIYATYLWAATNQPWQGEKPIRQITHSVE